jgi:hypothetical protein
MGSFSLETSSCTCLSTCVLCKVGVFMDPIKDINLYDNRNAASSIRPEKGKKVQSPFYYMLPAISSSTHREALASWHVSSNLISRIVASCSGQLNNKIVASHLQPFYNGSKRVRQHMFSIAMIVRLQNPKKRCGKLLPR